MDRAELIARMIVHGWMDAKAFVESCDDDELEEVAASLDLNPAHPLPLLKECPL